MGNRVFRNTTFTEGMTILNGNVKLENCYITQYAMLELLGNSKLTIRNSNIQCLIKRGQNSHIFMDNPIRVGIIKVYDPRKEASRINKILQKVI